MNALESAFYDFLQKQNAAEASNRIVVVDTSAANTDGLFWNVERFEPASPSGVRLQADPLLGPADCRVESADGASVDATLAARLARLRELVEAGGQP